MTTCSWQRQPGLRLQGFVMSNSLRHAATTLQLGVIGVVSEAHSKIQHRPLSPNFSMIGWFGLTMGCKKRLLGWRSQSSRLNL